MLDFLPQNFAYVVRQHHTSCIGTFCERFFTDSENCWAPLKAQNLLFFFCLWLPRKEHICKLVTKSNFYSFQILKSLTLYCTNMVPIFFLFFFIKIISFLLKLKQSSGFLWHFAPKVNIRCTWWWLCLPRYFNDLKGHFEICRLYKIQNYVPFITWYFTSAKCFTSLGKRLKKRKRIHNWSFKFKASP